MGLFVPKSCQPTLKEHFRIKKGHRNHSHHEDIGHHRFEVHVPEPFECDGFFVAKDCLIPISSVHCENPFNLRLAQLNQNLNFQLFAMKGSRVEIEFECQGGNDIVKGVICNIGTDFIDVLRDSGVVATILKERICRIDWKDRCFNPCSCSCHHDGHFHGHCEKCGCH